MALPNFIVIGAQKCGTTWLHANLSRHDDVYMPPAPHKELRYFCSNYDRGIHWYAEFFRGAGRAAAVGEATPNYTASRDSAVVAKRMHETLPDAKLIYVVRHPVERLQSGYTQLRASGVRLSSFRTALKSYPSILATSRYWDRLNDFLALYPRERVHCVFLEDIKRDPRRELTRCLDYLGVDAALPEGFPGGAVNRRKDLRGDRWPIVKSLRNSGAYRSVQSAVPRGLVKALKPVYQRQLDADTTWDAESLDWARNALFDDARQFLEFCGKPPDYWEWDSRPRAPARTAMQR